MDLKSFVQHYESRSGYKAKKTAKGYKARCCLHHDKTPSFFMDPGDSSEVVLKCHGGCDNESILRYLDLEFKDLFADSEPKPRKITQIHPYRDADGAVLYEVVRYDQGKPRPRRKAEDGGWAHSVNGGLHVKMPNGDWRRSRDDDKLSEMTTREFPDVKRVLYNLPELIKRKNDIVIICAGEKDADNLNARVGPGILAIAYPFGEGNWRSEYNEYLRDRVVISLPDNDESGRKGARKIKDNLQSVAASFRIIGLEVPKDGGDFSDWIEDHEIEELLDMIYGTEMPNARMAETAVIGAIFKNPILIHEATESNVEEHLFFNRHRAILKAMQSVKEIDRVTVGEALGKDLIRIGGWETLEELEDAGEPLESINRYISPIRTAYQKRELLKVANAVIDQTPTSKNLQRVKDRLAASLSVEIADERCSGDLRTITQQALFEYGDEKSKGLMTGYRDIDTITGGMLPGHLIVVGGKDKAGKSTLVSGIAHNVAKKDKVVLYVTLEMSMKELAINIMHSETLVSRKRFRAGNLSMDEIDRMNEYAEGSGIADTFIIEDNAGITVEGINAVVQREKIRHGRIDFVVVDYLQLMTSKGDKERHKEIGIMAKELRLMAKREQIPVLAVCQVLNRTLGMPTKHMLRESGEIAQHLDLLLLVHREDTEMPTPQNRGLAKVGISGRWVEEGQIDMAFLGDCAAFKSLTLHR